MVSRINTAMSYPHKETDKSTKNTKKIKIDDFQSILDKEIKKRGATNGRKLH